MCAMCKRKRKCIVKMKSMLMDEENAGTLANRVSVVKTKRSCVIT